MDKDKELFYTKTNKINGTIGVIKMNAAARSLLVEQEGCQKQEKSSDIVSAVERRKQIGLKSTSLFGKTLVEMYKEGT